MTEFHSLEYIQSLGSVHDWFEGLDEYVRIVAGASLDAARMLCNSEMDIVISWDSGRHHAKESEYSGFCYVNDCVLAGLVMLDTFRKVLYIDIDVHHGDGVQEAFEHSSRVYTVSFHHASLGFFPGTGLVDEIGFGKGKNHTLNVPLNAGLNGHNFMRIFEPVIQKIMETYEPNAIIMQCGADGLAFDRLGTWNLSLESIADAVDFVCDFNLPTLIMVYTLMQGGGGYDSINTAKCWALCTSRILKTPIGQEIPDHCHKSSYGPEYTLSQDLSQAPDLNDSFVDQIIQGCIEKILQIA